MFGRSNAIVFDSYHRRNSRRGPPRWLWLLLLGMVLGVAAVIGVQDSWLPPRLTADASARQTAAFEQADRERTRLQAELSTTRQRLQQATTERESLGSAMAASQQRTAELQADIAALIEALPPDPRAGAVQVRSARFKSDGSVLSYDIILTRARAGDKPWNGVLQLVLSGATGSNADATLRLEPVAVRMGRYASLRGSRRLPERFETRQASVQVLDRPQGQLQGLRVINLK